MHRGNPGASDTVLREEGIVRIYDIFFDYDVLLSTDAFFLKIVQGPEFQRPMSSAEFHALCGKYIREGEKALGIDNKSLLGVAYVRGAPVYFVTGRFVHRHERGRAGVVGHKCVINAEVNQTASIVLGVKARRGQERHLHLRRRKPQELRAPDGAADPGNARHR